METNRRGVLIIGIVCLALIAGVVLTVIHFRSNDNAETGGTIGSNKTSQPTSSDNNAADRPKSSDGSTTATKPTPAPAQNPAPQPSQLVNSGPGNSYIIIFAMSAAVAAVSHHVYQRRKSVG